MTAQLVSIIDVFLESHKAHKTALPCWETALFITPSGTKASSIVYLSLSEANSRGQCSSVEVVLQEVESSYSVSIALDISKDEEGINTPEAHSVINEMLAAAISLGSGFIQDARAKGFSIGDQGEIRIALNNESGEPLSLHVPASAALPEPDAPVPPQGSLPEVPVLSGQWF
jgi:hypothetical protein